MAVRTDQLKKEFKSYFPKFLEEVREIVKHNYREMSEDAVERTLDVLTYTVPDGKMVRGITVVLAYDCLTDESCKTPEARETAIKLGWCVEMLQASYCIADDVIDCSDIRRGKPTWHTLDDTGVNALIDSSFTHYIIFDILRSLLDNPSFHESFRPITNSFLRCHKKTMIGALHELIALQRDYATFTLSESRILGIYKTGYYTQMLPIFVGMNFSGIQDPELYRRAEDALAPMGHLYQAEDDYRDCFVSKEELGKSGTDIREGKCSWIFVTVLEKLDPTQKKVLLDNYGKLDKDSEERVKAIYMKMGVPKLFQEYKQSIIDEINQKIEMVPDETLRQLLVDFADISLLSLVRSLNTTDTEDYGDHTPDDPKEWEILAASSLNGVTSSASVSYLIFDLLKLYLNNPTYDYCYHNITDALLSLRTKAVVGMIYEYTIHKKSCEHFNWETNTTLALFASSWTYVLPILVGLHLCRVEDPDVCDQVEKALELIGYFFKTKVYPHTLPELNRNLVPVACGVEDYLDRLGKAGVIERKCTWPFLAALDAANGELRKILLENYGKPNTHYAELVANVYEEVGLEELFEKYQRKCYKEICGSIKKVEDAGLWRMLLVLADDIYNRSN